MKGINRLPFSVANHDFDLSNHRPTLLLAETKELMPTVIRLAKLMSYAAAVSPRAVSAESPKIDLNSQEEILNAITGFLNLVNNHYFPLNFLCLEIEEEEILDDQPYHPKLTKIPVDLVSFDIMHSEPDNYGQLVGLIAKLGTIFNDKDCSEFAKYGIKWNKEELNNFRFKHALPILEEMNLPSPVDGLPSLIRAVLHETNTFYFDTCSICDPLDGPEFEWTVKNFKWLQEDWQIAKPIYSKSEKLIKWSNGNQKGLKEISAILKRAHSIHMFYKDDACPEWF